MFKIKWGIFAGGAALVLALATSLLLGQTSFSIAALRALCFTVLFFGLGIGASALIYTFVPELLSLDDKDDITRDVFSAESPGSRVNITIGDSADPALPDDDNSAASVDNVEDFSGLTPGIGDSVKKAQPDNNKGIDQNPASSYTIMGAEEFSPALSDAEDNDSGGFSIDFGAFVSDGGGMGELDSYMDSMDSFSGLSDGDDSAKIEESSLPERKVSGNKPAKFEGDFDPKDLAVGIRTILQKDKRG
jgi:hypothetical protein